MTTTLWITAVIVASERGIDILEPSIKGAR